jgi:predicted dithiol-disulfide oxidoreductase (DUF899 family)
VTATRMQHKVVSREEWLKARLAHLAAEKEFTRKRDELSRQRRELPWERVEKNYIFEGPYGPHFTKELAGEVNYNYHKRRFGQEDAPGFSVFYKDEAGEIFHTQSGKNNRNKETDMDKNKERDMEHRKGHLAMKTPPIVSPQEWEAARQQLLVKEKELTRARDALAAERRRMPWLAVEKEYEFDGPKGKASLLDLFDGRRQLIVYRAFFEPGVYGWPEHACRGCSFLADQVAHLAHLNARDTTLAFVSRAPQADIERLKARMEWKMPWYSITDSFDTDFGVDEWHGTNAFIRDGNDVFRTYFINNRGDEQMGSTWNYLDITALGRQEEWEDSPEGYPQTPPYKWWNWHDNYDAEASPDPKWVEVSDAGEAAFRKRDAGDLDSADHQS